MKTKMCVLLSAGILFASWPRITWGAVRLVPSEYPTIQAGIDAAVDGDTVLVAPGTYTGTGNRNVEFRGKGITLKSESGPAGCTIDCECKGSAFFFYNGEDANSILDGFTIINGRGEWGGGICCGYSTSPVVTNCVLRGNESGGGGGIYCESASPLVSNCVFRENVRCGRGGGMYSRWNSNPTLINCSFVANEATEGGGFANYRSEARVINCSFSGNRALKGKAVANLGVDYGPGSSIEMTNCMVWNGADGISNDDTSILTASYSDIEGGWPGEGNIDKDPCLAFETDGHLTAGSPCIDAGTSSVPDELPGNDPDGNPRALDGDGDGDVVVDMGAYEYNPSAPSIAVSGQRFSHIKWYSPPAVRLQVRNCGGGSLRWEIRGGCDWLEITPTQGTSCGESDEVSLTIDANDLSAGEHVCHLRVMGEDSINSPVPIEVCAHVGSLLAVPEDFGTIQSAIDHAADYDTVVIQQGTYTGTGNRDIDFKGKRIIVRSTAPTDPNIVAATIIDCAGTETHPHRGFYFHSGEDQNSVLSGITIVNGFATYGGGIYCDESSPYIANCTMSENSAGAGGGIYCEESGPYIANCMMSENSASTGGGIYCEESEATVSSCRIGGNVAGWQGGGIYCQESRATISNCTISGNTAHEDGGGVYCWRYGEDRISNCTISGNRVGVFGGGIGCDRSSVTVADCLITCNAACEGGGIDGSWGIMKVTDCVVTGNTADCSGGGISFSRGSFLVANSVVSGNAASWLGGGACCRGSDGVVANCVVAGNKSEYRGSGILCDGGPVQITNSTITGNRGPEDSEALALGAHVMSVANCIVWNNWPTQIVYYHTPIVSYCDVQGGWEGEGNIEVDPRFVEGGYWDANGTPDDANDDFWVDGDYHLRADSGCINAGDPNFAAGPNDTDIDGEARVFAGRVDMGADEFTPLIECQMKFTPQVLNPCSKGNWAKVRCVLPPEFGLDHVDANSPLIIIEPVRIEAQDVNAFVNEEGMVEIWATFDRSALCSTAPGNRTITVVGSLTNGRDFHGTDTIRIITGNLKCLGELASHWLRGDCTGPHWCDGFDLDRNSEVNFMDLALSECCSYERVD